MGETVKMSGWTARRWLDSEEMTLRELSGKVPQAEIARSLGRTLQAVYQRTNLLGLSSVESRSLGHRSYSKNDAFFSVPNPLNSYWAGFIAADGCVYSGSRLRVRIQVQERDREHLERFAQDCGYGGSVKLRVRVPRKGGSGRMADLMISGVSKWAEDLHRNFSIVPRKTWFLSPPLSLTSECEAAYVAGYVDGDGCISIGKPFTPKRSLRQYRCIRLDVIGRLDVLKWIRRVVYESIGHTIKDVGLYPRRNLFVLSVCGYAVADFAARVRDLGVPIMGRKWTKVFGWRYLV